MFLQPESYRGSGATLLTSVSEAAQSTVEIIHHLVQYLRLPCQVSTGGESPDQTIMCLAASMSNLPLDEIGSILIATRDSDFTLVARAIEEKFGFGVIANSRNLND